MIPHRRSAMACFAITILLSSLSTSIINVGLPALMVAFGASFQAVQWVVLAYLLAITSLVVSAGRLGDLLGRRRLLLGGLAAFTVASAACSAAPGLGVLVAMRAIQGAGAAIMLAMATALVGDTVPKAQTGRAMGLLASMSSVGMTLGPSMGGVLLAGLGWRALFLINVPLGLLALGLAYRAVPVDRPTGRVRFDAAGTLALIVTLTAYALAMTAPSPMRPALLGAACVGLAVFLLVETRVPAPLLSLAMFRDTALSASLAMGALVSTVMIATLVIGPFYLARGLGLDAASTGLMMSIGPVVASVAGLGAGRLTDHVGAPAAMMAGLACFSGGAMLMSLAAGLVGYAGSISVISVGYAVFQTANNTAIMAGAPADRRGVLSGLLNLSRNLGLVTGASVMAALFAMASAGLPDPAAAAAHGLQTTFRVAAGLGVLTMGIAAFAVAGLAKAGRVV